MKGKNNKITEKDYIKAMKKASRDLEIELHGTQVSHRSCVKHSSKKIYSRKNVEKYAI